MPFTTEGKSGLAFLVTGSYVIPNGIEIGTGSSLKTAATTALVTPVLFRTFTGSADVSTPRYVTFTADYTSIEMSGLTLREFAVKRSGGTIWSAEGFTGVTFDGTSELQIQTTWEFY